jgi:hypothetical protein
MLTTVQKPADKAWVAVSTLEIACFGAGALLFFVFASWSETGFIPVLDHANLLFHEAGHPLVGIFSQRLETYGGTLGQLVFPAILAFSFRQKRQAISFAASVIWFFENWLNIARYMADARTQMLPLVGGGDHDWARIFGRWNALNYDTQIASAVWATGWVGMALACVWVVWRWWLSRNEPAPSPSLSAVP